jgi:hypothetical protein
MRRFPPARVTAFVKDRPTLVITCASISLLWIILVLPSVFLNELFTLDVGGVFNLAAHFHERLNWILSPYTGSGRYFPLYWLYNTALCSLFGFDIRGHFFALAVIFLLSALLTGVLFTNLVRDIRIALLFSLALFISSPNVESLYAFGKAEPAVYLLVSLILLLFHRGVTNPKALSPPACVAVAIAFTCSLFFKETSIALFAVPVAGILGTFVLNHSKCPTHRNTSPFRSYAPMLLCLGFGFALSKLPYLLFAFAKAAGHAPASYTAFSLTPKLIADNVVFYFTQQPDVTILGIVATFFVALIIRNALSSASKLDDKATADLIFVTSLLVMAWAYLSVFLFWRWSMAYYLYLPAFIFRIVAGYGVYTIFRLDLCARRVRIGSCVVICLVFFHAAVYLWYAAASQVTYSELYSDALRQYVKLSHDGDSLVFESYPFYSEQVVNTAQLLDDVFHETRRLYGIADLVDPAVVTPEMRQLLSISDEALANNEKNFPRKDDYVIDITGNELATWQVRGVAPYYREGSFLLKDGSYDMEMVAGRRAYFPSAYINLWNSHLGFAQTYVGYEIYRVVRGPRFTWLGRYPDGWMGRRARLTLFPEYVDHALVHISTSRYNPINSVSVFENDVLIDKMALSEGKEHTFKLRPVSTDAPTVFRFDVARTFVPQKLHLNKDKRELGAFVRLEPMAAKSK